MFGHIFTLIIQMSIYRAGLMPELVLQCTSLFIHQKKHNSVIPQFVYSQWCYVLAIEYISLPGDEQLYNFLGKVRSFVLKENMLSIQKQQPLNMFQGWVDTGCSSSIGLQTRRVCCCTFVAQCRSTRWVQLTLLSF